MSEKLKNKHNTISILLPTRGRVKRLKVFLDSLHSNTKFPGRVEIVLGIDSDDSETIGFEYKKFKIIKTVDERCGMGALNTRCLNHSSGRIILLANDDIKVETSFWDQKADELHSKYKDQIYLGYFNDSHKGEKLSTFPILSRSTLNLMVNPFPNNYKGALIDLDIFEIFQRLRGIGVNRIQYFPDVLFVHLHMLKFRDFSDRTYTDRTRFGDDQAFYQNTHARKEKVERLHNFILNKPYTGPTHKTTEDTTFLKFLLQTAIYSKLPILFKLKHLTKMSARFIFSKTCITSRNLPTSQRHGK